MSNISIKTFRDEATALYQQYDDSFAGRARATRDVEYLTTIIKDLESLIHRARQNEQLRNTPAFVEVFEVAIENLETYKTEREAIKKAQANPLLIEAAQASAKANRLFSIYGRHFAGKNRATRDLRLLEELIAELQSVKAQMERLVSDGVQETKEDLQVVSDHIQMYKGELSEIGQAQLSGDPEERISMFAQLANEQFRLYNAQFAGKSRSTRRAGLLTRMIDNLEDYRKQMRSIQELPNVTSATNTNNINIVSDNLQLYHDELAQIQSVRSNTSPSELAGQLGGAANDIRSEYREFFAGQDRATRSLERLGNLCDGLWEISRQMESLLPNTELDFNVQNLEYVNEWWTTYEREYTLIQEAIEANQ